MKLTVADVLMDDCLKGHKVIAGQDGLDRDVSYVDIIEVPDVKGWIKSGGILMTTGYAIKEGRKVQEKLMKDLIEGGAAALFIKKGRYLMEIPEIIIEMGNNFNLPVIMIPRDMPYKDIITPILSKILEKKTLILQKSRDIHDKLTKVVLEGGGIDLIAQNLYKIINRTVLIQDKKMNILAFVGKIEEEARIKENLVIPERICLDRFLYDKEPIRIKEANGNNFRVIAPIVVGGNIYGYVSVFENPGEEMEEFYYIAVQQAATVIALEMMKEKEKLETRKRLEANLIEDLLNEDYKSPQTIIQRAHYLGWDFERLYVVLVIDIDNLEEYYLKKNDEEHIQQIKEKIKEIVKQEFLLLNKDDILIFRSDALVIFFDCEELLESEIKEKVIEFSNRVKKRINRQIPEISVTIGIGNYYPEVMGLKRSYYEAIKAAQIGKNIKSNQDIFHYQDLGVYRVLVKCKDDPELQEFYQETLGKLEKYADKTDQEEILETIEVLLKHFGNKSRAAEELCIHRNSLNYRLKKIEELTNKSLKDNDNLLNIYLALKIKDIISKNRII